MIPRQLDPRPRAHHHRPLALVRQRRPQLRLAAHGRQRPQARGDGCGHHATLQHQRAARDQPLRLQEGQEQPELCRLQPALALGRRGRHSPASAQLLLADRVGDGALRSLLHRLRCALSRDLHGTVCRAIALRWHAFGRKQRAVLGLHPADDRHLTQIFSAKIAPCERVVNNVLLMSDATQYGARPKPTLQQINPADSYCDGRFPALFSAVVVFVFLCMGGGGV